MNRRNFLQFLGLGAAAAAAPTILIPEPEPVRRYWQVPRNAPVARGYDQPVYVSGAVIHSLRPGEAFDPVVRSVLVSTAPQTPEVAAMFSSVVGSLGSALAYAKKGEVIVIAPGHQESATVRVHDCVIRGPISFFGPDTVNNSLVNCWVRS